MKKSLLLLCLSVVLCVLAASCHKPEVEMTNGYVADTLKALSNRWYIVDYPFYQQCDVGSYVELYKDGTCHAYIQCNDEPDMDGSWTWDGKELFIDCPIFSDLPGVSPRGGIKTLDAQSLQMMITVPVLGTQVVKLSRINPQTHEIYTGNE
ncbi:MAG: hypothetical protein J5808_05975 [Paludibacteraceae bacterium]|nr:hypothetical protein [Paludibacteraceae bacterium]